jgi:hypothetical protein
MGIADFLASAIDPLTLAMRIFANKLAIDATTHAEAAVKRSRDPIEYMETRDAITAALLKKLPIITAKYTPPTPRT